MRDAPDFKALPDGGVRMIVNYPDGSGFEYDMDHVEAYAALTEMIEALYPNFEDAPVLYWP